MFDEDNKELLHAKPLSLALGFVQKVVISNTE